VKFLFVVDWCNNNYGQSEPPSPKGYAEAGESETNSGYAEGIPVERYPSRRQRKQTSPFRRWLNILHSFSLRDKFRRNDNEEKNNPQHKSFGIAQDKVAG
jgi:hypothetical protein